MTVDLAALRRGDRDAVDRFYRDHAALVLGWVIRLGGPRLDAEDVAGEVFETACRRLGAFRGEATLSTWLYGITRRVVANARRKVWVKRVLGMDQGPEPSVGPDAERLIHRREVQACLERLAPDHREVLVLVVLEERPAAEVAEMLRIPVGTVYSRVFHAKRVFAEMLERAGLADEGNVVPLGRRA
jgi:RNA polymerase sigma-70 factor (ECF subfamily)